MLSVVPLAVSPTDLVVLPSPSVAPPTVLPTPWPTPETVLPTVSVTPPTVFPTVSVTPPRMPPKPPDELVCEFDRGAAALLLLLFLRHVVMMAY